MKILHYVPSFLNGGIETMLVNVANMQAADGNSVAILIFTDKVSSDLVSKLAGSVRLFRVGKPVGNHNPIYVLKANRFYRSFAPDVFHFHSTDSCRLFPFKRKNERRVVTIHSNSLPVSAHTSVDRYVAISRCVRSYFRAETGISDCRICYNGIDTDAFTEKKDYASVPSRILSIGRLTPVKGMDILIRGFARIAERHPGIMLDIWGEGEQRSELEVMISDLSLQGKVRLCGNVPNCEVEKHLADYDLVIQASRHEGLGIAAIEAMAAGVPLLVSGIDGFLEVTEDGKYAAMFTGEDPVSLGDALDDIIENYPAAVTMAVTAVPHVHNIFSLRTLVDNLATIYDD